MTDKVVALSLTDKWGRECFVPLSAVAAVRRRVLIDWDVDKDMGIRRELSRKTTGSIVSLVNGEEVSSDLAPEDLLTNLAA